MALKKTKRVINEKAALIKNTILAQLEKSGLSDSIEVILSVDDAISLYKLYLTTQAQALDQDEPEAATKFHRLSLAYYKEFRNNLRSMGILLDQRIKRNDVGKKESTTSDAIAELLK